ncbi:hypothetical protein AN2689.2 [Aspergillus nidulans FGSC A4]|uniref:Nuclear pore complex subunit Nup133, putative (AFU_orthologue AFUA_5G14040) n=1 Tax=Emericella nidulans (strain FGSC A4 / ATCC 38163 / CBS 112.46 / NRRL 194 / M139) TaxID=227321 RepID=Q5B9U1_EMENI|nr:SUMO protease ULP1 [Aspergillus nidulans FGSC A4]EAA63091.1 hypothetical protein AN2689.2 [Aspergillus nidulans FGSC A4]CBF84207.1 TPA: nuclear pore complex subunit Nup133, putative (AFU_orthologue; AFUA_5G14040) [Aspergillus nidulans FGSC A4]|eukprot:XP_660293.1 hypothetical protein AN2689.2 [Aspergillus nidulans FGSC A4]
MDFVTNGQPSPKDTVMNDASPYDALHHQRTNRQFTSEDLADPNYVPNPVPFGAKKITPDETHRPFYHIHSRKPSQRPDMVLKHQKTAYSTTRRRYDSLSPPQFQFTRGRTGSQHEQAPLVLPRVNEIQPYRLTATTASRLNATTYSSSLMNPMRSSGHDSILGAGLRGRDRPLSLFGSEASRQAAMIRPRKRDREGNILDTTGSIFVRNNNANDGRNNDQQHIASADADSPVLKYCRGGTESSFSAAVDNIKKVNGDPVQPLAQRPSFHWQRALPSKTTDPATPGKQTGSSTATGRIPGCWPSASKHGSMPLLPEPQQTAQTQHQTESPVTSQEICGQVDLPSNANPEPATVNPDQAILDETPSWTQHYSGVYGTLRIAYSFQCGMVQTVANAFHVALAAASTITHQTQQALGTVTQRVMAMYRQRRFDRARSRARASPAAPARQPPTTIASPARVNVATLPPGQQERVRINQWRRRRGFPVNEELPFPNMTTPMGALFYDPQIITTSSPSVQRSLDLVVDNASGATLHRHPAQRRTSVNDRDDKNRPQAPKAGILKKNSLVPTMSPATRRRLLPGYITPRDRRLGLQHRVRFRSPIVQPSPLRLRQWANSSAESGPGLDELLRTQLNGADAPSTVASDQRTGPDEQLYAQLAASLEPYVDPWAQPRDFTKGTPRSAVKLVKPKIEPVPDGRSESIYAKEYEEMQKMKKLEYGPVGRQVPEGVAVRPLPDNWKARLKDLKKKAHWVEVATTPSGESLTRDDIDTCLTPMAWLNDEVINSYLGLIVNHMRHENGNAGRHDKPRYHAFNTFFFSNLRDKGYDSVKRWAKRAKIGGKDLLDVDTVFIPVHNKAHWTLIVVKPSARTIEHFDSLGSLSRRHVETVKGWLRGELGDLYDDDEWEVLPSESPQQDNGSDCGVFLLTTAKAVALNIEPLAYGARDTPLLRQKIVAELINGGFEGDFTPDGAL